MKKRIPQPREGMETNVEEKVTIFQFCVVVVAESNKFVSVFLPGKLDKFKKKSSRLCKTSKVECT